jgi:hypothetical protein
VIDRATGISVEASSACFSTHTNGTGPNLLKFCISNHGNVVQFESPAGAEHINVAPVGEGYIACSKAPTTGDIVAVGFDAGFAEENWGAPTITQPNGPNTFPLTITRETTNPQPSVFGQFRLKQVFSRDTNEKDLTITATLTNLLSVAREEVFLSRYYDADVNGTIADSSGQSADSVWAHDSAALSLTALTFAVPHGVSREKYANWDPNGPGVSSKHGRFACRTFTSDPPLAGADYVGWVTYSLGTLKANGSKTVKFVYRRF